MSEPGFWTMNDAEAAGLRDYLLKGGFIIFDDFRGVDLQNLQAQMRRVLPDGAFIELDRPIRSFIRSSRSTRSTSCRRTAATSAAVVLRRVRGQRSRTSA